MTATKVGEDDCPRHRPDLAPPGSPHYWTRKWQRLRDGDKRVRCELCGAYVWKSLFND